jgi:hypothetical protein
MPLADHRHSPDRRQGEPPQNVDGHADDGEDAADDSDAAEENSQGIQRRQGCRNSVLLRSLQSFVGVWT